MVWQLTENATNVKAVGDGTTEIVLLLNDDSSARLAIARGDSIIHIDVPPPVGNLNDTSITYYPQPADPQATTGRAGK